MDLVTMHRTLLHVRQEVQIPVYKQLALRYVYTLGRVGPKAADALIFTAHAGIGIDGALAEGARGPSG